MLSVSRISSGSRAATYYGRDDYYRTGEADAPKLRWGGKGAGRLGLAGEVARGRLKQVLVGEAFGGGAADQQRDRHPGWDFTFSAPKGVSLAILVGGDQRLDEAHTRAVATAMAYAETHLSFTRRREAGVRRPARTENLVFASCVHGVSREGDPQRHTHVIIANATWDAKVGAWRALESRPLFQRRMLLGKIYQAELAKEALILGYDVSRRRDGLFDLAAWTERQVRVFSKRSQAIHQALQVEQPRTPAAREVVKLKNRPRKLGLSRDQLAERWRTEAREAGLDIDTVVRGALAGRLGVDRTPQLSGRVSEAMSQARALADLTVRKGIAFVRGEEGRRGSADEARLAVEFGVAVQEVRSAVFTRHDLLERALDRAPAGTTVAALDAELQTLELSGRLLSAERRLDGGFTTDRALAVEADIRARIEAGRGRGESLPGPALNGSLRALRPLVLNVGQRQAAARVLLSPDRFVAVEGVAGAGKTTMLRVVERAARERRIELIGITPTHRAAIALTSEAGIRSATVAAWLSAADQRQAKRVSTRVSRWLLVDEASMISNAQMAAIMGAADKAGLTKLIFVGDPRQLGSPEAGAPFRLILHSGVEQARMDRVLRQRDPTLRESVQALAAGRVYPALRMVSDHIQEAGRGADDLALARAAIAASDDLGDGARIVVPTNSLRTTVAELVRAELLEKGELQRGEVRPHYSQVRLDGPERFLGARYRPGLRLVFHGPHPASGIPRGGEASVVGVDRRNDVLRIDGPLGDRTIDLRALGRQGRMPFTPYAVREMEVAIGERLVWEKADARRGFLTGAGFTVVDMDRAGWRIRHDDGREERIRVDDKALKFIGYGYAETADRAQGQTYHSVVAVLASRHGDSVTAARQYVMQSRPSERFRLITDETRLLVMKLASRDGLNRIALEHLDASLAPSGPSAAGRARHEQTRDQPSL